MITCLQKITCIVETPIVQFMSVHQSLSRQDCLLSAGHVIEVGEQDLCFRIQGTNAKYGHMPCVPGHLSYRCCFEGCMVWGRDLWQAHSHGSACISSWGEQWQQCASEFR